MEFPPIGGYDLNKINVTIHSPNWGQICYEPHTINASRVVVNVYRNPVDRLRGITLEEKILQRYSKIKSKLKKRNDELRELQEMELRIIKKLR